MKTWTYDGYVATVIGDRYSEAQAIEEWAGSSKRGGDLRVLISEWLGESESLVWVEGAEGRDGAEMPAEWADHHAKALDALVDAVESHRAEASEVAS